MYDIERIFPRGVPQRRGEAAPGTGAACPRQVSGRRRRSSPCDDAFESSGPGGGQEKERREQRCFPGAAWLPKERGMLSPLHRGRDPPLPTPPALERGVFDNCAIYLANKFADQLIPVTAALPEINYSEFKYNHWLIPTSSGPRLAIHPGE